MMIRVACRQIRSMGRYTQGVRIINIDEDDIVVGGREGRRPRGRQETAKTIKNPWRRANLARRSTLDESSGASTMKAPAKKEPTKNRSTKTAAAHRRP